MSTATQYECMSKRELAEKFDQLCGERPTGRPQIDELLREMAARLHRPNPTHPGNPPKGQ